jgi:hypothetical protein
MHVQYPIALLLLGLIPLVLFMRRRRPTARLRVSNLYLWTQAPPVDTPALVRHLRRHWILVLQIAVLGLTAVSAAGLHVDGGSASVAVVLDASITMGIRNGGATRFDTARAQVNSLLDRLPGSTRVRLIAADPRPHLVGEFRASDPAARRTLDDLSVTDAAADLGRAIEFARNSSEQPSRIYVFSDAAPLETASNAGIEWSSVGGPADNTAISNVAVRRSVNEGDIEVLVTVVNQGESPVSSELGVTVDEETVGQQPVSIPSRDRMAYSFQLRKREGVVTAHLAHQDALLADNVRSIVVPPRVNIRVLLAGDRSFFLEKALSAHPEVTLVTSAAVQPDVTVCNACTQVPPGTASVLLIPQRRGGTPDPVTILKSGTDHPVTDGLDFDGTLAIRTVADLTPRGAVIALAGGEPAIVVEDTGTRRILELGLDSTEGPFPLSPAFPMLIANAVNWLSQKNENPVAITAGEPLRWNVGGQSQTPAVLGTGNRTVPSTFANGILTLADTGTAGVYRIRLDAGYRMLAVNPAVRDESNPAAASEGRVLRADTPVSTTPGTNLTVLLALAALAALTVEWLYGLVATRMA